MLKPRMRIIAGSAKGHAIKSLAGTDTRPTLDKVRGAVFNVLQNKLEGARFLDLFAGSGAVGIEALSRGAQFCYFNDSQKKALALIRENLRHCRLESNARIFSMDARPLLDLLSQEPGLSFDIVYLDPPYDSAWYEPLMQQLQESGLLSDLAIVVVETDRKIRLPESIAQLVLVKNKVYGGTILWYYQLR